MKISKYFIVLTLLFVLFPAITFSATNDFVADSDITVSDVSFGTGTADMLILNSSTAESWTFDGGAFTVTNPGTFKVGSSDSSVKSIQVSQSGSVSVCTENTTPGTSYATVPTSSGTYTVQPSSTTDCTNLCTTLSNTATYNSYSTCGAATCNSGYRLSGSGASATCVQIGGGGIFYGTLPNLQEPRYQTIYPDGTIVYRDKEVAEETPTTEIKKTTVNISAVFMKTLRKGVQSDDVKRLQELLASDLSIYPEGITSGYFGNLTEKAVQRFQIKYNIVSSGMPETTGYGLVGPKTRLKLQEVFGEEVMTTSIPTQVVSPKDISVIFNTSLMKGMSNSDTKRLQQLLNTDPDTQVATSGVGSVGNETNYFGDLTEKAVQRFQTKYGIVSSGTPDSTGYGYVGPKTRARLQEVFGQ